MNQSEQRRAITKACGWRHQYSNAKGEMRWYSPEGENYLLPPDYFSDLNAMREAEEWLIKHDILLWLKYTDELRRICDRVYGFACGAYHATAEQKAEAFLRAIGKWEDI